MIESAVYRFYRNTRFALPWKQWSRLPRLASHKNEYSKGFVYLTPRPRTCDVYLKLRNWAPIVDAYEDRPGRLDISIRPLSAEHWDLLPEVYHAAFSQLQPLYSWNKYAAATASRAIMRWARRGKDGPVLNEACFVAYARPKQRSESREFKLCGASIVTFISSHHLWKVPDDDAKPHSDFPGQKVLPHLNWLFVSPPHQRSGVAALLLKHTVEALREQNFGTLASTFTADGFESMRWHWRHGFLHGYQSEKPVVDTEHAG